ncbi:carboxypeptidase N subunit 2-like [Oppia nitens]|uniref:carboxypeptidase N subunit 2-like n=1 Tax=Oppia nitens TaxID=1686743 RepID=UPI0023DB437A|nr:carboxypeptidase N subunit 2-like [Oppia nitens]
MRFRFINIVVFICLATSGLPLTRAADKSADDDGSCETKVENCRCFMAGKNRPELECTREKLKHIPSASLWPENIFALDVSMNVIKNIDVVDSNDALEYLDLASNQIESISPHAFDGLTKLRGLDLSHNELVAIPSELFNNQLLTLNLSYNKIEILPKDMLKKTTYLQELRIAHNPLRMLEPDLFQYSGQLKSLDLSAIDLFAIKEDIFHYLFEMSELDLSDNDFMVVPTTPLRSARNLQILKLNGNPISILDEHSFIKMSGLQELYLDDMKELIEIKEKTFSYLYNLRKISISNNPHLSYIDNHAFYGIFNRSWMAIQEANLRANRLSYLADTTLPFCNLTSLDLRENPWACDCHILWAKYCHLRPELTHGIICASPSKFRGDDLMLIDHTEIHCEHSQMYAEVRLMRLFLIVFVSFTLFFIALVFVLFIKRDVFMKWWSNRRRGTGAIYYVKAHSNPIEPEF